MTDATCLVHPFIMRPPHQERFEGRAFYWKQVTYSEESIICGLIWYIQVSLVHSGYLPNNISLALVKARHPLMPFIYSEAVCLFNIFYQNNISSEIVVKDCVEYPQLGGNRGQIQSYNRLDSILYESIHRIRHAHMSMLSVHGAFAQG